jgi:hypothetical protein
MRASPSTARGFPLRAGGEAGDHWLDWYLERRSCLETEHTESSASEDSSSEPTQALGGTYALSVLATPMMEKVLLKNRCQLVTLLALGVACSSPSQEAPSASGAAGSSGSAGVPAASAGSASQSSAGAPTGGAGGGAGGGLGVGAAGGVAVAGSSSASGASAMAGEGGASGAAAGGPSVAGAGGAGSGQSGTPTFVAVGYAGRRVRSVDLGVTWVDDQTLGGGGDDEFLLRAVAFGSGVFVAVGYKILTSVDGVTWQPHTNPQNQWLGGVVFHDDAFVAVGGYGYSARSSDGASWSVTGTVGSNQASRSLAFGQGMFVAAADVSNQPVKDWYQSSNGDSWSLLSGGHSSNQIAFCDGAFRDYDSCSGAFAARGRATFQGVTIRVAGGVLQRSTNGSDFAPIAGSPEGLEDVALGYVE